MTELELEQQVRFARGLERRELFLVERYCARGEPWLKQPRRKHARIVRSAIERAWLEALVLLLRWLLS